MDSLFGVHQKLVSLHGYPLTKAAAVLQEAPLPGMAPRGAGAAHANGYTNGTIRDAPPPSLIAVEDISDAEVRTCGTLHISQTLQRRHCDN